jgi:hypothetical protein
VRQGNPPHLDENTSAAPRFSPGVVRADELVIRTVLDPSHLEPDGRLKPAAIALQDLQTRGWSVARRSFTSARRVRAAHSRWQERDPSIKRCYVMPIKVLDLRRVDPFSGQQNLIVLDTAAWLSPDHASVLLSARMSQSVARSIRDQLIQTLPPYTDLEKAFGPGADFGFARGMWKQLVAIMRHAFTSRRA